MGIIPAFSFKSSQYRTDIILLPSPHASDSLSHSCLSTVGDVGCLWWTEGWSVSSCVVFKILLDQMKMLRHKDENKMFFWLVRDVVLTGFRTWILYSDSCPIMWNNVEPMKVWNQFSLINDFNIKYDKTRGCDIVIIIQYVGKWAWGQQKTSGH